MIEVNLPASMTCDAPGCNASWPVQLCLLGTGGFAFKGVEGWQVLLPQGPMALGSPFKSHCPEHRTKLQVGPAGPRVVLANEH